MNHRHLLPEEIDLLLDGEEGFGVNPLTEHLSTCPGCRAEFEAQREVTTALERLPHFTPSRLFAARVMCKVEVFEPWHVAARESVRRWLPQSHAGRSLAFGAGGVTAVAMTFLTVWLAHRADAVLFVGSLVAQRSREAVSGAVQGAVVSTLGQGAATAVETNGAIGWSIALAGAALAILGTAFALKTVASAARGRRS
ncbi:MAG: hypothetical protein Q8K82_20885 [Gemmatimonadaceae bacterium]|nr:hypothetical protein [Gemmatimonadaceae bacterium]